MSETISSEPLIAAERAPDRAIYASNAELQPIGTAESAPSTAIGHRLNSSRKLARSRVGEIGINRAFAVFASLCAAAVIFAACDSETPTAEVVSDVKVKTVPSPPPSVAIYVDDVVEIPAVSPTAIPAPTSTASPTLTPTPSPEPAATSTPSPTPTSKVFPTRTPTESPTPTISPTLTPTSTPLPTKTAVPTPSPSPPVPSDSHRTLTQVASLEIEDDSTWVDVIGQFSESERQCIRETASAEELEALLAQSTLIYDVSPLFVWACLSQPTAVELMTAMWVDTLGIDETRRDPRLARKCVYVLFETTDITMYQSIIDSDELSPRNEVALSLYFDIAGCLGHGVSYRDSETIMPFNLSRDATLLWDVFALGLSDEELSCVETNVGPPHFGADQDLPIFDGTTEPWEVDVWRCLTQETAKEILSLKLALDFESYKSYSPETSEECGMGLTFEWKCLFLEQVSFSPQPFGSETDLNNLTVEDEKCLDQTLARIDYSRLISAGLPDATLIDAMYAMGTRAAIALCVEFYMAIDSADDHAQDFDNATQLVLGETIEGELARKLDSSPDIDLFSFAAESEQSYQIDFTFGDIESLLAVTLMDVEGEELATLAPDWSTQDETQIIWQAASSGIHYLGLFYLWDHLDYTITINESSYVDDHGNSAEVATLISLNDRVDGEIAVAQDVDYFTFAVEKDLTYLIEIETAADITRALLDEDGSELIPPDQVWEGLRELTQWQAVKTGNLYLAIEGDYEATGGYSVTVSQSEDVDDHGDTFDTATDISAGGSFSGEIGTENDIDIFTFFAEPGSSFVLDYSFDVEIDMFDYEVIVYDENGDELRRNTYGSHGLMPTMILSNLNPGPHFIAISTFYHGVGKYGIVVARYEDDHGDSPQTATRAEIGKTLSGEFQTDKEIDYFRFDATTGQPYRFSMTFDDSEYVDSFYGYALVVNAQDQPMFRGRHRLTYPGSDWSWLEMRPQRSFVWIARETAEFYLVLSGYQDGFYDFIIEPIQHTDDHGDDAATASVIPVGESVDGALIAIDDIDYFGIDVEAGKRYKIEFELEQYAAVRIQVFDPDGEKILDVEPDSGQPIKYHGYDLAAGKSGRYHIAVTATIHAAYTVTVKERIDP